MKPGIDPEVLADIRKRAESERERPSYGTPSYMAPEHIRETRCRNASCPDGRPSIEVTPAALERLAVCNAQLVARGEPPISIDETLVCPGCRRALEAYHAIKARERHERMGMLIRELRAPSAPSPEREREIEKQLTEHGHPDVKGLIQSISERRGMRRGARGV